MKTLISLTLALLATSALAQKAAPLDVKIQQVNDRRTNGSFSHLTITLELPKVRSSEVTASRVFVTTATDDSGRSLLDPEAGEPQLEYNMRPANAKETAPPPATVSITLPNPDRKAVTVKDVRGEIELYMPGKDPNSVAEIPKFLSTSGKPLTHKALKANGVEIALISPAQLQAERKRVIDAKRKEAKEAGWQDGEDLEAMIKSNTESLWTANEGDLLVRVKDPNQRLQELVYLDAAGEEQRISSRDEEGLFWFSTWGEKPQADWKLKVSMKTPKSLVRYPFALKDVALP